MDEDNPNRQAVPRIDCVPVTTDWEFKGRLAGIFSSDVADIELEVTFSGFLYENGQGRLRKSSGREGR